MLLNLEDGHQNLTNDHWSLHPGRLRRQKFQMQILHLLLHYLSPINDLRKEVYRQEVNRDLPLDLRHRHGLENSLAKGETVRRRGPECSSLT